MKSLYQSVKKTDPSRLVEDNSPCLYDHVITDINSWHQYLPARQWASFFDHVVKDTYPGSEWNYTGGNKQTDIPMMNSECGAVWGYNYGTGDIDISYEYHIMINEFRKRPKIAGFIFTEFHDVINEWNGYYRYDRSEKDFGLDELCPGMTVSDFHSEMYLIPGKDFEKVVKPGSKITLPLTGSFMADNVPAEMTVKTLLHGWDRFGEHKTFSTDRFIINPTPYAVGTVRSLEITAPDEECLAVFCTYLIDDAGQTVHHNFMPLRVFRGDSARKEKDGGKTDILRITPDKYSQSEWSVKQMSIMDGLKVWGMGTGFFEYEFPLPEGLSAGSIDKVEFIAELSARHVQGKYFVEGEYKRQSISNVGEKGIDPGHSPNSFPMTDNKKHSSTVVITLNDLSAQTVFLKDDPADHRGLLSWLSQKSGKQTWGDRRDKLNWKLEEAGSYGYLTKISFGQESLEKSVKEGVFRIKLAVSESSENSGGLAVYGEHFGRYPLDPTVIINLK